MRKFGIVHSRYWSWALENKLNDFTKALGAYFLSCDHGNSIGCFKCSVAYVSDDLGNPLQTVSKGFANLSETQFLVFCEASKYVFLPKYLKWNPLQNTNQLKGALKLIESFPSSFSHTRKVLEYIKKLTDNRYFSDDNLKLFETLLKPLANPLPTPCQPIRTTDTDTDTDIEMETDTDTTEKFDPMEFFDSFWNGFDKKTDRKKCEVVFKKLNEQSVNAILETVKNYVLANPDRQFRKNPLTYLHGECWNDEIVLPVKNKKGFVNQQNLSRTDHNKQVVNDLLKEFESEEHDE